MLFIAGIVCCSAVECPLQQLLFGNSLLSWNLLKSCLFIIMTLQVPGMDCRLAKLGTVLAVFLIKILKSFISRE